MNRLSRAAQEPNRFYLSRMYKSGSRYLQSDVCRPNALSGPVSGDYSAPGVGK